MSSYMATLCEVSSYNFLDLNITICEVVHRKHNLENNHVKHQHPGPHPVLGKVPGTVSAFRLHWDFCRPRWGNAGIDSGQVILPIGI